MVDGRLGIVIGTTGILVQNLIIDKINLPYGPDRLQ